MEDGKNGIDVAETTRKKCTQKIREDQIEDGAFELKRFIRNQEWFLVASVKMA